MLQMISVPDIGKYVARGFTNGDKLNRREIDLAADELSIPDATLHLSRGLGRNISFAQIPISDVRKNNEDFATMLEWFDRVGYNVDIPSLEREFGIEGTRFVDWARQQRA